MLPLVLLAGRQTAAAAKPHPAVARIIVPERGGASLGSGTLVAVNERHGLVITNWHVVRDGNGQVTVVFPDGFHSGATVLKVDRDWDLAALAIWRPHVAPVRLADAVPRPGEPLTIAGYGSGKFRMATGRCTQFVSPGGNLPFEMLELSAQARQGDSGGPILNQRGELAGVLFGASWGRTAGSHCGRVQNFLASISGEFRDLPDSRTMIAGRAAPAMPRPMQPQTTVQPQSPAQPSQNLQPGKRFQHPRDAHGEAYAMNRDNGPPDHGSPGHGTPVAAIVTRSTARPSAVPSQAPPTSGEAAAPASGAATVTLDWEDFAGVTWPSRIKTFLAMVGLLAIFVQGVRLLGPKS